MEVGLAGRSDRVVGVRPAVRNIVADEHGRLFSVRFLIIPAERQSTGADLYQLLIRDFIVERIPKDDQREASVSTLFIGLELLEPTQEGSVVIPSLEPIRPLHEGRVSEQVLELAGIQVVGDHIDAAQTTCREVFELCRIVKDIAQLVEADAERMLLTHSKNDLTAHDGFPLCSVDTIIYGII